MTLVDRILGRLRKPITNQDTADVPATARDEVEVILGSCGPLALHEIIAQNVHDHSLGLARLWSPEALEEGLGALLTTGDVGAFGFTFHHGEAVGIFTATPTGGSES